MCLYTQLIAISVIHFRWPKQLLLQFTPRLVEFAIIGQFRQQRLLQTGHSRMCAIIQIRFCFCFSYTR